MQKSNDRKGSKEVVENEARPTKEGQAAHRFIKDIEPFLYGRPITYVDVGAHVGTVLNTLLKSSVDVREVHLVEPNPTSFSTLQEKVAGITKVKSITCHNVAISAASGTVPMRDEGTMTHVIAPSADAPPNGISTHTFEAKTSTLDELSRLCEVDHIALLKIDVEGHELEVLEGTKHLLGTESIDIIYVEAGVNPDTTQQTYYRAIEDVLRNYGYRLFRIYEQMHEWLDDSPLLRRVNLAFMSARFVANNPYKLSRELFNLRAQKDALAEEVKGLQSAFDEQQIANQRLEQTITKLKAQLDEADANSAVEIARLQSEISRRDNTIARTTEELAALSSQLATTEIRLTSLQKERDDHAEEVATLKQNQERVEKEAQSTVKRLTSERDAFIKYSDELKAKYLRVLRSRSWRIMGPFRFVVRTVKGFMTGKPPSLNRLPKRPSLHASGRDNQGKATHRMMPLRRKPSLSERVKDVARASLPSSVKSALTVRHKAERTVQLLRKRMLDLGFVERAKAEFIEWANDDSKPYRRGLAAWELATWYLNQPSEEDARKALDYLPVATSRVSDPEIQRGAAIMTAEAYHRLGDIAKAQEVLSREVRGGEHPDFSLARSNLETTLEGKINWINRALRQCQIQEIHLRTGGPAAHPYDRLAAGEFPTMSGDDLPLISVIMPAYNSEDTIGTAIKSVLIQSWRNLEMLVVDDCSADGTAAVVEKFCRKDFRVRLIRAEVNAGPYVARNLALKEASGEFVTCHDADDWSHPQKLELQARHLLKYPNLVANHSEQARARSDLQFCRRGKAGVFIFPNFSSFMFRRVPVSNELGFWDSVRFGADTEFIRRARRIFGKNAIENLSTGPVSFQRQSSGSLTGDSAFGYHGYFMGARMEYFHQHEQYHGSGADLKYEFPQKTRPFAVPEPFWPAREAKAGERRHYDVIIVSDFRFKGGSTLSSIEEINAHLAANLRTGLLQMSRYDHDPDTRMNLKVRETLVHPNVDVIVYGEKVSCDLLIVRYPPVLQELQRFVPDIDAKNIRVIINQTPMSDYGKDGVLRYDIPRCAAHLQHYFGKSATWHPIGPAVRETLYKYHADGLSAINFSSEDWVNIIDVDEWQRSKRPERNKRPRIGRHSRDHIVKWPESKHELLQIYPDSDKYEVAILGGAKIARSVLGRIPSNWRVLGFNEITPKNFLAELDVFIYYTHSGWIESFGRVIIEAMASGVPVIVPHAYKALFREAALYAEPKDVLSLVDKLMKDPDHYENRVQIGLEYVRQNFGYEKHMERVGWLIGRNLTVPSNEVPQEFLSSRVLKR